MDTLTHYYVPQWIAMAFMIAIPFPFILLVLFIRKAAKETPYKLAYPMVAAFLVLYLAYSTIAAFNGWFNQVSLPPKVLLLSTFPFALLLFGVVLHTNAYKAIVAHSPLENLVAIHLFRLLGIFFVLLAVHDALPKPFAFIAGFGDMLTAVSSIFVAKAIKHKKSYAKTLTWCWNIFGTIDILFTAIAANVLTKLSMDNGVMGVDTLAMFPFCIIPAFAPPAILFLHWAVFKKLKQFSA